MKVEVKRPDKPDPGKGPKKVEALEPDDTPCTGPSVVWSGHFTDYSGYAKANREILFRVANVLKVNLLTTGLEEGLIQVDRHTRRRVEIHRNTRVHERAPLLRFFGPDYVPKEQGHKICWTMMETYKVHHQMVAMVNNSYDELWTPTKWNGEVFRESGVRVPIRSVPLGVNPLIYKPKTGAELPKCRLLTTDKAGTRAVPKGFAFISVGLPSFRKGFDILAEAFDLAFRGHDDVHLVFAITHSIPEWNRKVYKQFSGQKTSIWTLEGQYDEHEMASIYSASGCYVSASRGEGWNLPVCEAAACGVPVIVPDNTSHPEVVGSDGWMFDTEGVRIDPMGRTVSPWYEGMPFSTLGQESIKHLAELMRTVKEGGEEVQRRALDLRARMRSRWTWDNAAHTVTERLLEVQP